MSTTKPKKSGETAAEKNPSVESELVDKPSDFKPGDEPGERHTDALIPGTGVGDVTIPDVFKAKESSEGKALTSDSPLEAFRKATEGVDVPEGGVTVNVGAFQESKAISGDEEVHPDFRVDDEPSNRELAPTEEPPPAGNDGLMRYRVWPHGSIRFQGRRKAAGSFLNLTPDEAKELVDLGRLELVPRTAGAECPKCGKGTNATLPCSKECFAAAGYDPDNFDDFVNMRVTLGKSDAAKKE